jgi:hypothetical protein
MLYYERDFGSTPPSLTGILNGSYGTYSSVENVELGLGAHHADDGLRVRHPDGRVFVGGLLAALFQQIFDALVDVSHPLL